MYMYNCSSIMPLSIARGHIAHVHRYEIIIMRMCGCPRICCETSTAHVVEDEFYVVNLISSHVLANGKT